MKDRYFGEAKPRRTSGGEADWVSRTAKPMRTYYLCKAYWQCDPVDDSRSEDNDSWRARLIECDISDRWATRTREKSWSVQLNDHSIQCHRGHNSQCQERCRPAELKQFLTLFSTLLAFS